MMDNILQQYDLNASRSKDLSKHSPVGFDVLTIGRRPCRTSVESRNVLCNVVRGARKDLFDSR